MSRATKKSVAQDELCPTCQTFTTFTVESGIIVCSGCMHPSDQCPCDSEVIEVFGS